MDGFPPKDVLRTVYVEHDIDGSLSDLNCVEFVFADENLQVGRASGGRAGGGALGRPLRGGRLPQGLGGPG